MGRLGSALYKVLDALGYRVKGIGRKNALTNLGNLIFITVQDGDIKKLAEKLVELHPNLSGKQVVHCSGTRPIDDLITLETAGAHIGCFHPMMAVTEHTHSFEGVTFDVIGHKRVVDTLRKLVQQMKAHLIEVNQQQKERLHVAAVVASNYQVTLMQLATEIATQAGLNKEEVRKALLPLMYSVLENLNQLPPNKALTGPIARADTATIAQHVKLLQNQPQILNIYQKLGVLSVDMLTDKQLDATVKDRIKQALYGQ